MSEMAAHLVGRVFPPVPARQWVCSLPPELRLAVALDRRLSADVLEAFSSALLRQLRWRVKRELGLERVTDALPGAITFVQRSDSSLRVWPHFHTLAADGAWVRSSDGTLRFHTLGEPTPQDVAQVATWTHARLLRVLERHGRAESLASDEPVLVSCYGASAADVQLLGAEPGERTAKLFGPVSYAEPRAPLPAAEVGGVNVHVGAAIDGRDRRRDVAGVPVHGQAAGLPGAPYAARRQRPVRVQKNVEERDEGGPALPAGFHRPPVCPRAAAPLSHPQVPWSSRGRQRRSAGDRPQP